MPRRKPLKWYESRRAELLFFFLATAAIECFFAKKIDKDEFQKIGSNGVVTTALVGYLTKRKLL